MGKGSCLYPFLLLIASGGPQAHAAPSTIVLVLHAELPSSGQHAAKTTSPAIGGPRGMDRSAEAPVAVPAYGPVHYDPNPGHCLKCVPPGGGASIICLHDQQLPICKAAGTLRPDVALSAARSALKLSAQAFQDASTGKAELSPAGSTWVDVSIQVPGAVRLSVSGAQITCADGGCTIEMDLPLQIGGPSAASAAACQPARISLEEKNRRSAIYAQANAALDQIENSLVK